MKVDFLAFLPPGLHTGMDALARGLAKGVAERGGELRLRVGGDDPDASLNAAVHDGVDAVFLFVSNPMIPSPTNVQAAIQAGVSVYAIHRPCYPVSGCIVVPNFYQGVALSNRLAMELAPASKIAILGCPKILDDEEMVLGCLDGAKRAGLQVVNDPFLDEYRNLHDIQGVSAKIIEKIMKDWYPFDGLIVFNDETMHDVVEYLSKTKQLGLFPMVSRNGSQAAMDWVRKGTITATLDYGLPEIGYLAATLLDSGPKTQMGPIGTVYDRSNVDEYVSWSVRAPESYELNTI